MNLNSINKLKYLLKMKSKNKLSQTSRNIIKIIKIKFKKFKISCEIENHLQYDKLFIN